MASPTSSQLINWDSYNRALAEIKLQDNYSTAFRILNEAEMRPEQVLQLPAPTGESAYGYKNYADGAIATWYSNYSSTVENVPDVVSQINSNAGAGATNTYNWQFSANTDYSGGGSGGSTGSTFYGSDVTPAGGASSAISFIQNTVTPAVAAAGLGIKLGKAIDSALYNANPNFWDNNGMSSLNPQTWDSITMDMSDSGWEGVLKRGFNAIFGINTNTQKSQMYIDSDAAAYLAMYMDSAGVFPTGASVTSDWSSIENTLQGTYYHYYDDPLTMCGGYTTLWHYGYADQEIDIFPQTDTQRVFVIKKYTNDNIELGFESRIFIVSTSTPYILRNGSTLNVNVVGTYVIDGVTYKVGTSYREGTRTATYDREVTEDIGQIIPYSATLRLSITGSRDYEDIARILFKGVIHESGGDMPTGFSNQDGATLPDFTGCETPADYKQALQQQYPDMFQNAITQDVAQPDGTVVRHVYIPVGTPTGTGNQTTTDPDTAGQSQSQTETDPATSPEALVRTILETLTKTYTPTDTPTDTTNPPDTGEGSTPTVVTPTGNASALWSVYNPSQTELNSFGAWLWSSNFIDQVLKLFNNPMQSIIGVHKIFATPATSGTGNITVGYLSSGVSANLVSNQYTDIDCGTVKLSEQFANIFDYTDTQIRLYLPFIGIVDLDVSDVMRGSVKVVYHVDVITGACLAEVKITRDGSGGTLYQYAGDAAVRYPISSGSYMGVVAGIASAVGSVASAVMTGGATLPMAAGAIAGGISGAHTQVQHSGNFSGNAGAMGGKKPYLIIERPQTMLADGFATYQGKGANVRRTVGQMNGYFKFSDVHTNSITGAAESEIEAIRAALESGVIA